MTTVNRWMPTTLEELRRALDEIMAEAATDGATAETVYVDVRDIALVRKKLSDGSIVCNVLVRETR